mmetsp:Transcript_68208/g.181503  ORF Transcript_68208/g.181503 Transcript_68208/m.181503 type:complete len:328 (+) Transcript_68208:54-1037(+)
MHCGQHGAASQLQAPRRHPRRLLVDVPVQWRLGGLDELGEAGQVGEDLLRGVALGRGRAHDVHHLAAVNGGCGDGILDEYDVHAVVVHRAKGRGRDAIVGPSTCEDDRVDPPGLQHGEEDLATLLVEVGELVQVQGVDRARSLLVGLGCQLIHGLDSLFIKDVSRIQLLLHTPWAIVAINGTVHAVVVAPNPVRPDDRQLQLVELLQELLHGGHDVADVGLVALLHVLNDEDEVPLVGVQPPGALDDQDVVSCGIAFVLRHHVRGSVSTRRLAIVWVRLKVVHALVSVGGQLVGKGPENVVAARVVLRRGKDLRCRLALQEQEAEKS